MPGRWTHLAVRFIDVVTSKPLTSEERSSVTAWLTEPAEAELFFDQPDADQRHGFAAARWVQASAPERADLIRAALLHDVGKRHAALGPIGRALASAAIKVGVRLPPRWALYRDHGSLGAAELASAVPLVEDFARCHHGDRPDTISPDDWDLLIQADSAGWGR